MDSWTETPSPKMAVLSPEAKVRSVVTVITGGEKTNVNNTDTLLAQNYVNGVRFYYAMLMKFGRGQAKNNIEHVKTVLNNNLAQKQIRNYHPVGAKNKIVK